MVRNAFGLSDLTGSLHCARAAGRLMADRGGSVVLFGSLASHFGLNYASAYAASKGDVVQLAKSLAVERTIGEFEGRIVAVPGAASGIGFEVASDLFRLSAHVFAIDSSAAGLQRLVEHTDRSTRITPIECDISNTEMVRAVFARIGVGAGHLAQVVLFLLSDAAKFINGEDVNVSGGLMMH